MRNHIIILAFLALSITSCNKENDPDDEDKFSDVFVLTLSGDENSPVFWNEATITLVANDVESLSEVKIYLGTSLLGTVSGSNLTFSFDTRVHQNGNYNLNLEPYDLDGQKHSKIAIPIEINNNLLDITVGSEPAFLGKRYVVVTDNDGKLIGYVNAVGSGSVSIERPSDFGDETFGITYVYENDPTRRLTTYFNVPPSDLKVGFANDGPSYEGSAHVQFTDIPEHSMHTIGYGSGSSSSTFTMPNSINMSVYHPTSDSYYDAYVYVEGDEPGYMTLSDLKTGESQNVSLNNLNKSMSKFSFTSEGTDLQLNTFRIRGHFIEGEYTSPYRAVYYNHYYDQHPKTIDYYVPTDGELFPEYVMYAVAENSEESKEYQFWNYGEISNSFEKISANVDITNADITSSTYSLSGDYDYQYVRWRSYSADPWQYNYWYIYSPGKANINFPEFPDEIKQTYAWLKPGTFTSGDEASINTNLIEADFIKSYGDVLDHFVFDGAESTSVNRRYKIIIDKVNLLEVGRSNSNNKEIPESNIDEPEDRH